MARIAANAIGVLIADLSVARPFGSAVSQSDCRLCGESMRDRFEEDGELLLNVTGGHDLARQGPAKDQKHD